MTTKYLLKHPAALVNPVPLPFYPANNPQRVKQNNRIVLGIILSLMLWLVSTSRLAAQQLVPVEIMAGNRYVLYQHGIAKPFKPDSKLGWQHITNLITRYNTNIEKKGMPNEIMNQAYVTGKISKSFTVLAGGYYTNATNFRASAAIQYAKRHQDWLVILMPRVDLWHKGAADVFGLVEYRPQLSQHIKLYTRLQVMTNNGPYHHNRSYQRFRLGLDTGGFQFGLALELDEYGAETNSFVNTGFFIRKEIF